MRRYHPWPRETITNSNQTGNSRTDGAGAQRPRTAGEPPQRPPTDGYFEQVSAMVPDLPLVEAQLAFAEPS